METTNLIYHLLVVLMSIVMFNTKITAPNDFLEIILKSLVKLDSLFCMLYAGVQLFKHFGII